jgi:hypothetical protein
MERNNMTKEYRVGITLEEGVSVIVVADNKKEAEQKAFNLVEDHGGTDYPKEYSPKSLHRDYSVTDAQEIT